MTLRHRAGAEELLNERRGEYRRERAMFLTAALLSLLLLADDMMMLHEIVMPRYFGVPDAAFVAALGASVLLFAICFRRQILRRLPLLFMATLACFGGAAVFDARPLETGQYLAEDGFKLLGIAGWFGFWVQRAALELSPVAADLTLADAANVCGAMERAVNPPPTDTSHQAARSPVGLE